LYQETVENGGWAHLVFSTPAGKEHEHLLPGHIIYIRCNHPFLISCLINAKRHENNRRQKA
jgi:hypothetical protein